MKIIIDAMGGDLAPEAPVLGALQGAKDFGAQITLVGRGAEILQVMKRLPTPTMWWICTTTRQRFCTSGRILPWWWA